MIKLTPVIYMRRSLAEDEEFEAASNYFMMAERRTAIPSNSFVIPRYSALPFNKELSDDIFALGGTLINTHEQHVYAADMRNWYEDIKEFTPETWFSLEDVPDNRGPFVLKGATNSKKNLWSTHCFAKNKQEAVQVYLRLKEDGYIGNQDIYIRQFVHLNKVCDPITSLVSPVSEEYRFFVYNGEVLAKGFYWTTYWDDIDDNIKRFIDPRNVPKEFLNTIISRIGPHIPFFVVDIARTSLGQWLVVEINDGQQSGLCAIDVPRCINPDYFYENLYNAVAKLENVRAV